MTTTNTIAIDLNRLTLRELKKAFEKPLPEAKLVAKVQTEMKAFPLGQRALASMKAPIAWCAGRAPGATSAPRASIRPIT
mgnify:CR=1 FL=1